MCIDQINFVKDFVPNHPNDTPANPLFRQVQTTIFCNGWNGGKNMAKYHVGEKNDWKGMKKVGKMHIFSPIGKKYVYFSPNWLKIYKITKKGLQFFACNAHDLIVINIIWGKNMNQEWRELNGIHNTYPVIIGWLDSRTYELKNRKYFRI